MSDFLGIYLREARENKNLSIEDIANDTKIQKRYLEALESEEFESLPGETYIKGFLKTYAQTVGLDSKEVIEKYNNYKNNYKESKDIEIDEVETVEDKTIVKNVLIAASVLIVFYLIVTLIGTFSRANDEQMVKEITKPVKTAENKEPTKTENGIVVNTSNMKNIRIIGVGKSWLEIKDGEKDIFKGYIEKGEEKEVISKNKISIKIGDASLVKIKKNGQDVGKLGEPKEVVRKEF